MSQLALNLEPGMAQKYRDLRECFAACVYQRGLGRVAAALDVAPSNLSAALSGERNLDCGWVERYMAHFGDTTPALYMAARWLQDADTLQRQAMAAIPALVSELSRLAELARGGTQ
jgi:hypothetical protein